MLHLHNRQFVVDRRAHAFGDDWRQIPLGEGVVLSHQTNLEVRRVGATVVIGTAFLTGPEDGADRRRMAGRYVTIDWPFLDLDASSLLAIHYRPGSTLLSSSPALLAALGPDGEIGVELPRHGVNWVPGPLSMAAGARKLLPGQRFDLRSGEALDADPLPKLDINKDEAVETVATELCAVVTEASDRGELQLALTAGLDSRTVLAALLASGVPFRAYTQGPEGHEDIATAAAISCKLGIEHVAILPEPPDPSVPATWRAHTLGSYNDADNNNLFPKKQYRFVGPDTLMLRGGCFEVGRRYFASKLDGLSFETATGMSILRRFRAAQTPELASAFDRWLEGKRARPGRLDLIDSFYLEQRLGSWLSAIEQGMDMLPGRSVQPANSPRIISALLSPDEATRRAGGIQRDVIRYLAPSLLQFPTNPGRRLRSYKRAIRKRIDRVVNMLRSG